MYKITIKPVNGIDLGKGIGHLAQGEHVVKLTAKLADELAAAGIDIEKQSANANQTDEK